MTDDLDARAGEYVLGTLPVDERREFEANMATDPAPRDAVRDWNERLSPLADRVAPVQPPADLWDRIASRAEPSRMRSGGRLELSAPPPPVVDLDEIRRLRRSRSLWRLGALAASALAASMILFVVLVTPPAPEAPVAGENFVAVVNRGGELPALIVRVDTREGVVRVRSLAAEAPAESSLELWYIEGDAAPRSLGLVADGAVPMPTPALFTAAEGATLAVSVEPRGGSTTGAPTGPVVYSGQLIRDE